MGLLDILGYVGETLDKPGAALRGTLAGQPDQLLNLLPFSDMAGITDPATRVSGRDLLEQYNLLAPNTPGLDWGDVAGFGAEEALDPLNWIPGGFLAKQGLKGAGRLGSAMGGMMGMARHAPAWSDDLEGLLPRLSDQEVLDMDTDWAFETRRLGMVPPAHQADQMGTVFEPDDIQGMYDQYLAMNPAPAYYSRLEKAVQGLPERFKTASLPNLLKRAPEGFAKEEWDLRGMPAWMEYGAGNAGDITERDQLMKYLDVNALDIYPNSVDPKYQHYLAAKDALEIDPSYRETLMKWNTGRADYNSPHFFGEKNPLLHVRSTLRPNPFGEGQMRFADEIQSDWHQAGAKHGYAPPDAATIPVDVQSDGAATFVRAMGPNGLPISIAYLEPRGASYALRTNEGGGRLLGLVGTREEGLEKATQYVRGSAQKYLPTDAPLKEDWPRLGFKELLRQAIDDNAQAAGWTTGNQIRRVVGGGVEGQKQFYDQQLLNIAKKYLKQWGVEPQPFGSRSNQPLSRHLQDFELEDFQNMGVTDDQLDNFLTLDDVQGNPLDDSLEGFGFPITDRMRRDILSKGQPLLSVMPWLAAALGGGAAASRLGQGEPSVY